MSERAGLLSSKQKNPGGLDPLLLFPGHAPPVVVGYVQSIYMEKAARRHTPLENRSVSEGLNESGETGAECSGEKITHLDAESGINRC